MQAQQEESWYKTWGECPYCKKQFVSKAFYYKHIEKKHHCTPIEPLFLKRFNCIRCGKKLSKEEHEIDTGNLGEDCRKVTINEDERQ